MTASVAEGLAAVRARIARACERAGRDPAGVELVAVSKRHPPEAVRAAHAAGQRAFGENYVQELVEKARAVADLPGVRWHFIGHLQRNKAKDVVNLGAVVETVDSARLADALSQRAVGAGVSVPVLLQVNVEGEAGKAGAAPADVPALVEHTRGLPGLELRGLMLIPRHHDDPEASRPAFAALARLGRELGLSQLSMGMSHDLEVAVEEGATLVRVGTAIFGPRPG